MNLKLRISTPMARAGFTLLEMVIALSLVAVIMVIVLGALRLGMRAWEKGEASIARQNRSRIVLQRLRRQLSQAVVEDDEGGDINRPGFSGDVHSITFTSASAINPDLSFGWVDVRYRVEIDGSGHAHLNAYERMHVGRNAEPGQADIWPQEPIELVDGFDAFRFEFLNPEAPEHELDWQQQWHSRPGRQLPRAVRLIYREQLGREQLGREQLGREQPGREQKGREPNGPVVHVIVQLNGVS